jgi:hypothetical protein
VARQRLDSLLAAVGYRSHPLRPDIFRDHRVDAHVSWPQLWRSRLSAQRSHKHTLDILGFHGFFELFGLIFFQRQLRCEPPHQHICGEQPQALSRSCTFELWAWRG